MLYENQTRFSNSVQWTDLVVGIFVEKKYT